VGELKMAELTERFKNRAIETLADLFEEVDGKISTKCGWAYKVFRTNQTRFTPSKIFMGFGFNPDLEERGERIDILKYFSELLWYKDVGKMVVLWDASCINIVNVTPQKKLKSLNPVTGSGLIDILLGELERPKRSQIRRNSDLRGYYLARINQVVGLEADYIDAGQVLRKDKSFAVCLDEALDYVERLKVESPEILKKINPNNPNPASRLYLPLEIAESIYLQKKYDVDGKFGPITEEFFDYCILGVQEARGIAYTVFYCGNGPRRAGYLSDPRSITTKSSKDFDSYLLQDTPYRDWLIESISGLNKEGAPLLNFIQSIKQSIGNPP
jgi:hypothetical protein